MTKNELVALFVGLIFFVLMFLPGEPPATARGRLLFLVGALVSFGIGLILMLSGAK